MVAVTEGFVPFRGMRTWYRIAGDLDSGKVPLLLLHGGPGTGSDAFEPLEALAGTGRAVVRYDQIGCGYSDRPGDPGLWTAGTFVDELLTVRRELRLDRVHLLGWSWGGMLALEYLLTVRQDVDSLILASSPVSVSRWNRSRLGCASSRYSVRPLPPTSACGHGRAHSDYPLRLARAACPA